jgi:hypothetical protein
LEGFLKEVLMDNDFNANSGCIHLSEYVDKTLEAYLVLTYVNSYEVWREEECLRNMPLEEEPQLMHDGHHAAQKKWKAEGRGSGKYQGWSKTGIDTYNALLVDVIAKQRLNIRNKTILSNFESNLCQTFADQQAAEPGRRGNTGTRKRKAANSLSLGLESPTGFVLQGLPSTGSTMMGV